MRIIAKKIHSHMRLDKFLIDRQRTHTRSFWQKAIDSKYVTVNGQAVSSSYKLKVQDKIQILLPELTTAKIDLSIIYEDSDVVVINKPAGLLTHSKGDFNPEPTVATYIAPKLRGIYGERAGIVHRLDRATSGIIICAKNALAQKFLQKQFSTRKVEKTYIAIVGGTIKPKEAIIDLPIGRNPKKPQTFRVMPGGKPAQTHYKLTGETFKNNKHYSLIELKPKTGRTHQLRVHLTYLKVPILGDVLYGGEQYKRLMLHARALKIRLPSGKVKEFRAAIPSEFTKFMVTK